MKRQTAAVVVLAIALVSGEVSPAFAQTEYLVAVDPIRIGAGPGGICVAIDPADPGGVWWWGPGRTGCATRGSIPGPRQENVTGLAALFHPPDGVVSRNQAGETEARFRLGLHGPPDYIDLDLVVRGSQIESVTSGVRVGVKRVRELDIPLLPPYGPLVH